MCIIIFSVPIYIIYTPVSTTCNTISIYKWLEKNQNLITSWSTFITSNMG